MSNYEYVAWYSSLPDSRLVVPDFWFGHAVQLSDYLRDLKNHGQRLAPGSVLYFAIAGLVRHFQAPVSPELVLPGVEPDNNNVTVGTVRVMLHNLVTEALDQLGYPSFV